MVAIPAADRVKPNGKVVALEPAEDSRDELLRYARNLKVEDAITLIDGEADKIPLDDEAVDVVLTRSVLIYVERKEEAIAEFLRVLRTNGTLVCWEPLSRNGYLRDVGFFNPETLAGLGDLGTFIHEIAKGRIEKYCSEMIDFTEHDLVDLCWKAGFRDISMEASRWVHLQTLQGDTPFDAIGWDSWKSPGLPPEREYLEQHLTADELEKFRSFVTELFEAGDVTVPSDGGLCLLKAVK